MASRILYIPDKKIVNFIIFLSISSCINLHVPKYIKDLNPYKKGDVLVLRSSSGSFDTIIITNVYEKKVDRENLPVLIGRNTLEVEGLSLSDFGTYRKRLAIKKLISFKQKKSLPSDLIYFGLTINSDYELIKRIHNIDSFINLPRVEMQVNGVNYTDVIILTIEYKSTFVQNRVKLVYWSISKGFLRLINYNNDSTELRKKYTDMDLYNKYKNVEYN